MNTTTHPAGLRLFAPIGAESRIARRESRLPVKVFVIRTDRDLGDAVDAYTALRVALIAEIGHTEATTFDYPDPAIREIDRDRLAEARAQLVRVDGTLGMMTTRRR